MTFFTFISFASFVLHAPAATPPNTYQDPCSKRVFQASIMWYHLLFALYEWQAIAFDHGWEKYGAYTDFG